MPIKGFITILLFLGTMTALMNCQKDYDGINGTLKEETKIIEKNIQRIWETDHKLREAEKVNRLQSQLDFKRELNELIIDMNSALRKCSEKYSSGRNIPFMQSKNSGGFEVKEVKLVGCRFNAETMDVEIQLMAKARIKDYKNDFLSAGLLNEEGKDLGEIKFLFTNDYPEKGKVVNLLSHPENFNSIKTFSKIVFN